MERTLRGIEETLQSILESQRVTFENLKGDLKSLEESFNMLSQKWNLQIIYTLLLKNKVNFSELKKILGANSRTLSDKLKNLKSLGYVDRMVKIGPPLRVEYTLTSKGKNTVLMALPLLYYLSSSASL